MDDRVESGSRGGGAAVPVERLEAAERDRQAKEDLRRLATELFPDGKSATLLVVAADGSKGWVRVTLVVFGCVAIMRATVLVVGSVAPVV